MTNSRKEATARAAILIQPASLCMTPVIENPTGTSPSDVGKASKRMKPWLVGKRKSPSGMAWYGGCSCAVVSQRFSLGGVVMTSLRLLGAVLVALLILVAGLCSQRRA